MKRRPTPRPVTPEAFAVPVLVGYPPCAKACGTCASCREAKDGALRWLKKTEKTKGSE